jgi:hypothetical protein
VGPDGNTSVAIVRTGGYSEYGFGGYIFQPDGDVTLPTEGQAKYVGTDNYGGLRDFDGRGGLEYVRGDIEIAIDFDDFNDGSGVRGNVTNRRIYDLDNEDITQQVLTAIGVGSTELPILLFEVSAGALDINGELAGITLSRDPRDGDEFEKGNYYAVLSGDQANTITGIIVVTGEDPRFQDVTFRETAGFFAVRE